MTLGDRVVVMRKGELQQAATAQEVYSNPVNLFVAGFIGSPAMNLVEAEVAQNGAGLEIALGRDSVRLDEQEHHRWGDALKQYVGRKIVVGVRPENLEDASVAGDTPDGRRLSARAELVETLGSEVVVHLGLDARPVVTDDVRELARDVDEAAVEDLERQRAAHRAICVGRFAPSTSIRKGETVTVAVERGSLHFFDVDSGRAL